MNLKIPKNQRQWTAGFTMIELVICLGIIAFALVAIIGVLPVGISAEGQPRGDYHRAGRDVLDGGNPEWCHRSG